MSNFLIDQNIPRYLSIPNQWCNKKLKTLLIAPFAHESFRLIQLADRVMDVAIVTFLKLIALPLHGVGTLLSLCVSGPSPHLLFNVVANSFGKNSKLEGMSRIKPLRYFKTFIESRDPPFEGMTPQLKEMISKATTLEASWFYQSTLSAQIADAFAKQTRLLIPAGWAGEPNGHAIYWELIPLSHDEASVRLFNLGAGVEHNAWRQAGVKEKYQVGCEWQGIKKDALLNPEFIQAFHEIKTKSKTPKGHNTNYGVYDIYEALREKLKPTKVVPLEEENQQEESLQSIGNCAWKSLIVCLRTHLKIEDYKTIKFHFEKQLLIDHVQSNRYPTLIDYRSVTKSTAKFCRSLKELKKQGVLSEKDLIEARESLKPVFAWIKQHKHLETSTQSLAIGQRKHLTRNRLSIPPMPSLVPPQMMKTEGASLIDFCLSADVKEDTCIDTLEKAVPFFEEAWKKGEDQMLNTSFIHLIKKLPDDSTMWRSYDPEHSQKLITLLGKMATPFFKSCFMVPHATQVHPERLEAMKKVFAIQCLLLKNIDGDLLPCFGIDPKTHRFLRLYDKNSRTGFNWVDYSSYPYYYSSEVSSYDATFNGHQCFSIDMDRSNFPRGKLLDLIGGVDKVREEFGGLIPLRNAYDSLAHEKFKDSRIIMSKHLPEWFKALQMTQAQSIHLVTHPIVPPPTLNRETDLTFSWDISDWIYEGKPRSSSVYWTLRGVTPKMLKQYPELQDYKDQQNQYQNLLRPIKSTAIQKMIDKLFIKPRQKEKYKSEKNLLSTLTKDNDTGLKEEEYEELLHLVIDKDRFQIIEALEYFTKHQNKLQDPDYQTLFKLLFFERDLLTNALKHHTLLEEKLASFLQTAFHAYQNQNNLQTCAFLLQMSRYISSFAEKKDLFYHSQKEVRSLLKKEGLRPEDKSVLYAEFLASFCREKTMTKEDAAEILTAHKFLYQYGIPKEWQDPEIQKEIRETLIVHQTMIQQVLGSNQTLESYLTIDNQTAPIPLRILESPHFTSLYPRITEGIKTKEGYYKFTDSRGFSTRVFLSQDTVCIEREMKKGEWHRLVFRELLEKERDFGWLETAWIWLLSQVGLFDPPPESDAVSSALPSRHLVQDYDHWLSPDSKTLSLTKKNSDVVVYKGSIDPWSRQVCSLVKCEDGTVLGAPSELFTHFEDPSYIEEWYDPTTDELKGVDLPRYGLSFKMNDSSQLISDQFPGFHLKLEGSVPSLGTFPHFLLLENDQGEQKVILPDNTFVKPKEGYEALLSTFQRDLKLGLGDTSKFHYAVYSVEKEGLFKTEKLSHYFYLAQIFTIAQKYTSAISILKKQGDKSTLYTKEEQSKLRSVISNEATGDWDPDAVALRTYAGFLLTKNTLLKGSGVESKDLEPLKTNYISYLRTIRHVTQLKLSREEELFILRTLLKNSCWAPALSIRFKELSPQEQFVEPKEDEVPSKPLASPNFTHLKDALSIEDCDMLDSLLGHFFRLRWKSLLEYIFFSQGWKYFSLISRPQEMLTTHFPFFFQLATQGSQREKEYLAYTLSFLKHSPEEEDRALYLFYTALLSHPDAFPLPPNRANSWDNRKWRNAVVERAETLMTQQLSQSKTQQIKLDPINRATEVKEEEPEPFKLAFKLSPVESFVKQCKEDILSKKEEQDSSLNELDEFLTQHEKGQDGSEISRLRKDIKAYSDQPKTAFVLTEKGLQGIKEAAKDGLEQEMKEIKDLEIKIVQLANVKHSSDFKKAETRLLKEGGLHQPLTLQDVLMSFGRQDPLLLQRRNSALTEEQGNDLHQQAGLYLLKATQQQQRQRVLTKVDELETTKNEKEIYSITQELVDHLRERCYLPDDCPAYLVFEYYANILIRPDQIEKLAEFLKTGNHRLIKEIMPGDGKSKFYVPILEFLRANGKNLSLVIATQALSESLFSDTRAILGESFAQKVHTIHFDRNTDCNESMLQCLLEDLQTIIKNRDCLIMTNKSVGCLVLKLIELLMIHFKNGAKEYSQEILLMRQIINLLRQTGHPLLDEADSILNIMLELCFSIGEASTPALMDIEVTGMVIDILYQDEEIKAIAQLESDPQPNEKAPALNEKTYETQLKKPLAKKLWERLKQHKHIKGFAEKMSNEDEALALDYLLRTKGKEKEAQKLFDSISDETVQDALALAGEYVSHLLSHTLTRECDKHYGIDSLSESLLSIPFRGANAPNRGSQFANQHITMLLTAEANAKKKIPLETLRHVIERLQEQAMKELLEESNLEKTKAWQAFLVIRENLNIPLFNLNESQLEKLHQQLNSSLKQKLRFVEKVILPEMKVYDSKISWNPQNFASFFNTYLTGFTGTLWNGISMHSSLVPKPEAGTEAKILNILWKQSRDAIHILKEGTEDEILNQVNDFTYDAFIDGAGLLKGDLKKEGNQAIAKAMSALRKKPIVFYNELGEQMITNGVKTVPLIHSPWKENEWIVFYDQSRIRGADVKVNDKGVDDKGEVQWENNQLKDKKKEGGMGIISIGRKMLLLDLIQGVKRLRKLGLSQSITFFMTTEVEELIRQELLMKKEDQIRFDHILLYAIHNQKEQLDKDLLKSIKDQMNNVPQMELLNQFLDLEFPPENSKELLEKLWKQKTNLPARKLYGQLPLEQPSDQVIEAEANRCKKILTDELKIDVEDKSLEEIDLIEKRKEQLPKLIIDRSKNDQDQSMEIEQEIQKEEEKEIQEIKEPEEIQLGYVDSKSLNHYEDFIGAENGAGVPCFPLNSFLKQDNDLKPYAKAFDGVNLSMNVLNWSNKSNQKKLLGRYRTPFHHLQIDDNGITILSTHEASSKSNYNLTLGFLKKSEERHLDDKALKTLVKIKFLNGISHYTKNEIRLLKEWIKEVGQELMKELLIKHILSGCPVKMMAYQNSILKQILE